MGNTVSPDPMALEVASEETCASRTSTCVWVKYLMPHKDKIFSGHSDHYSMDQTQPCYNDTFRVLKSPGIKVLPSEQSCFSKQWESLSSY